MRDGFFVNFKALTSSVLMTVAHALAKSYSAVT